MTAKLEGQKRLVQSVSDRLCAFKLESALSTEATAAKAYCSGCGSRDFTQYQ